MVSIEIQKHMDKREETWLKLQPLTFQLGYSDGVDLPSSFNYRKELRVPINSFSNPNVQKKQYIKGWKAGRRKQKSILKKMRNH